MAWGGKQGEGRVGGGGGTLLLLQQEPQQFAVGNTKNINVCGLIAIPLPVRHRSLFPETKTGHLYESQKREAPLNARSIVR